MHSGQPNKLLSPYLVLTHKPSHSREREREGPATPIDCRRSPSVHRRFNETSHPLVPVYPTSETDQSRRNWSCAATRSGGSGGAYGSRHFVELHRYGMLLSHLCFS
ncbi:hypothetical protein Hanom_Chr16g01421481 [Helianthus anomalus]